MFNYATINKFLVDLGYINQYTEREYDYQLGNVEYTQVLNCRNQLDCFKHFIYSVDESLSSDRGKKESEEEKLLQKKPNFFFDPNEVLDPTNAKNPLLCTSVMLDKCKQ